MCDISDLIISSQVNKIDHNTPLPVIRLQDDTLEMDSIYTDVAEKLEKELSSDSWAEVFPAYADSTLEVIHVVWCNIVHLTTL